MEVGKAKRTPYTSSSAMYPSSDFNFPLKMEDKIREAVEYFENLRHCTRCSGAESAELEYFDLAIAALEGQGMPAGKAVM